MKIYNVRRRPGGGNFCCGKDRFEIRLLACELRSRYSRSDRRNPCGSSRLARGRSLTVTGFDTPQGVLPGAAAPSPGLAAQPQPPEVRRDSALQQRVPARRA